MKTYITKLKDEAIRIETRAEICIEILQSIVFKRKPGEDDIQKIKKVIQILENK
jgi:hypothetical protein